MMLIKTKITTSLLMPLLQMALMTLLLMLLQQLSYSLLLPSLVLAVFSLHLLLFLAKSFTDKYCYRLHIQRSRSRFQVHVDAFSFPSPFRGDPSLVLPIRAMSFHDSSHCGT